MINNAVPLQIMPILVPLEGTKPSDTDEEPLGAVLSMYFIRRDNSEQGYPMPASLLLTANTLDELKEKICTIVEEEYNAALKQEEAHQNGFSNISS